MDKAFFLLTDVDVLDGSHQILHRLINPRANAISYAIIPDFQVLRNCREEFPLANFLFLDLTKSVNVNKEVLTCLPELDCILNYSGDAFSESLHRVREIKVTKTPCLDCDNVTIRVMHEEMESNLEIGTVVINVQKKERRGSSTAEALEKLKKKEARKRMEEEAANGQVTRFRPGLKFYVPPSPSPSPQPGSSSNMPPPTENQPLLSHRHQTPSPQSTCPNLFSWISCCIPNFCCPRVVSPELPEFESEEQLRSYVRGEHHLILRRKLKRMAENAESHWHEIMIQLGDNEQRKINNLLLAIQQRQRREEAELELVAVAQNEDTEAKLSEVLSEDVMERIKTSRLRHAEAKPVWDAEQEYKTQEEVIKGQTEAERLVKEQEHYCVWVQKQLEILRGTKDRARLKYERLYFETFNRQAPMDSM